MSSGPRLTRVGVVTIVFLIAAVVALFLGSAVVQVIAIVVIVAIGALVVAERMPTGVTRGNLLAQGFRGDEPDIPEGPEATPDAEYIAEAPEASDAAWEHEEALYREKEQREREGK